MPRDGTRLALFIDGANAHATAKALGFDIDYKRLLTEFQSRGTLVRALYYTAIFEDQEYSSIRPLIDWLDYNGFTVVTKPAKEFDDGEGRRKFKRSMRVELAVDAWRSQTKSITSCCFPAMGISARCSKPCSAEASTSASFPVCEANHR